MKSLRMGAARVLLVGALGGCGGGPAPPIVVPPQAQFSALYDYPRPVVEQLFWARHDEIALLYRVFFNDYEQAWVDEQIAQSAFDAFLEIYELYTQLVDRLAEYPPDGEPSAAYLQWLEERHRALAQRHEAMMVIYRTEAPGAPELFRRGHDALASRHWELLVIIEALQS